jgi:hypothetical protein
LAVMPVENAATSARATGFTLSATLSATNLFPETPALPRRGKPRPWRYLCSAKKTGGSNLAPAGVMQKVCVSESTQNLSAPIFRRMITAIAPNPNNAQVAGSGITASSALLTRKVPPLVIFPLLAEVPVRVVAVVIIRNS